MRVARTTSTSAQEEAVWEALWGRGYGCPELTERLAKTALESMAEGETLEDAVKFAERRYGVQPRGLWCPTCETGDTTDHLETGRCDACETWMEVA